MSGTGAVRTLTINDPDYDAGAVTLTEVNKAGNDVANFSYTIPSA